MKSYIPFGDIFELEREPLTVDSAEAYREIGIKSFGNGIFYRESRIGSELSKLKYFHVRPNRLIFSNIMAWEGAVAVSTREEEGSVASQRFLAYRPLVREVDLEYVNYFFQTDEGAALIRSASTGTVKRNQTLSPSAIEAMLIPIPALEEQQRIVAKLDVALKDLPEITRRRESLQQALSPALLRYEFASDFPTQRAGDLLRLERSPLNVQPLEQYSYIGVRSFGKGVIRYPSTFGSKLSKLRYFTFPINALVLSNIKAWEGAVAVTSDAERGFIASNRFLFYIPRCSNSVDPRFVAYYLLSSSGLVQLGRASPGSADRNRTLSMTGFEKLPIPVPPINTQRKIVDQLDRARVHLGKLVNRRLKLEDALRPALLNAAFSGQI